MEHKTSNKGNQLVKLPEGSKIVKFVSTGLCLVEISGSIYWIDLRYLAVVDSTIYLRRIKYKQLFGELPNYGTLETNTPYLEVFEKMTYDGLSIKVICDGEEESGEE